MQGGCRVRDHQEAHLTKKQIAKLHGRNATALPSLAAIATHSPQQAPLSSSQLSPFTIPKYLTEPHEKLAEATQARLTLERQQRQEEEDFQAALDASLNDFNTFPTTIVGLAPTSAKSKALSHPFVRNRQ
ncbi:hypothetical protein CVT25_015670 [Psilocybe cyanescens]|uniref:Uncharacterized protein n=1 Tax=Psilocybe cyanescens TaxID=93625 RepID=A0A409WSI8_PSICY|nr:hypothetical protein CVT25_015670 [Psilocybe cyanescens]